MYLLDTNVVSELRRPRPHGAVIAWLESVADADLYLSAVTIGEIEDAMIAAIATVHNLTVVTRNVRDIKKLHVPTLIPFARGSTSRASPWADQPIPRRHGGGDCGKHLIA